MEIFAQLVILNVKHVLASLFVNLVTLDFTLVDHNALIVLILVLNVIQLVYALNVKVTHINSV